MPSPLSGLTQPAASPISAQLRPGDAGDTAPPIGNNADVGARSWPLLEFVTTLVGVEPHQRLDRDVGRPPGGRERADPDVHLAGPERKIQP